MLYKSARKRGIIWAASANRVSMGNLSRDAVFYRSCCEIVRLVNERCGGKFEIEMENAEGEAGSSDL